MHKPILNKTANSFGDTYTYILSAGIHIKIYEIFDRAQGTVESILFSEAGAFRFTFGNEIEPANINKVHPLREIISLCVIAFPSSNEWIQAKISRSLVGKNIIKPTDEYIDAHTDYLLENYPSTFPTRNMRILAPKYALHLASKRALEILKHPGVSDIQKVICSLPFAVASRQECPLDVVLLDKSYIDIDCDEFTAGIIKRIDPCNLTSDQKALLFRSAQIVTGEAVL